MMMRAFSLVQPSIYITMWCYFSMSVLIAPTLSIQVQPAFAKSGTLEDEMLGQWLWDGLAIEDGESAVPQPGQPPRPRRRQLVYLDDYAPKDVPTGLVGKGGGAGFGASKQQIRPGDSLDEIATAGEEDVLTMQGTAMLNRRFQKQREMLRNPEFDYEMWLFRSGRFHSR